MRKNLRFSFLLLGTCCLSAITFAQNDRFAFAVTDLQQTGSGWNAIRKLDLATGEYSQVLFNGMDGKLAVYDAATKKEFTPAADAKFGNIMQFPFYSGVAATAYDKKNNRLYFTPMFIDQLRYVDLKTMKVYYVNEKPFTKFGNLHNDEGKIITRMVIAPDGNGYAVSNDASTFIKFSTGKNLQVTQLGSLVDDPANGGVSIYNRCSSWGGDMVADDAGNLVIITSRNSIYKVKIETKVASLQGYIKGLSKDFTSNGAVVTNEGKILVSSAVSNDSYFIVNPKDWTATAFKTAGSVYRSSDLANSNYLQTKPQTNVPEFTTRKIPGNIIASSKIMVYPNPVSNNQFMLQFGKITAGTYNLELTDVMGRVVMQRNVNVQAEDQVESISLKSTMARGIYLVKIIDQENKSVLSQKLVVQ